MESAMIEKTWLTIIGNKTNPLFWLPLAVFWILSLFYRLGLFFKFAFISLRKLSVPVISVGNITVGGSGKTPVVDEITRHFQEKNKKIGIVSSGYGRKNKQLLSGLGADIARMNIDDIGDEILMLSQSLPDAYFAVGPSKSEAAVFLERTHRPDVIIIDDGFQHRQLHRDFDILLLDAGIDLRSESLLPMGRLREPLSAIKRSNQILITKVNLGAENNPFPEWINGQFADKNPISVSFENNFLVSKTEKISIDDASASRPYFFAGIGQFAPLLEHIRRLFPGLAGYRFFPDHCPYNKTHLEQIRQDIKKFTPDRIITTRKDYVKLEAFDFGPPIYYLDLLLEFEKAESFWSKIDTLIERL
jgi:tetraacyldisaccharide 4'-kinase